MEVRVLASITWDSNASGTENKSNFVVDDFDITDRKKCNRVGMDTLIEFGLDPTKVKPTKDTLMPISFVAESGAFANTRYVAAYSNARRYDIHIFFRYICVHRGKIFELPELGGTQFTDLT